CYASLKVACELFERARKEQRHLLFFVHGYNNDMGDILRTARKLEKLYGVIVVPFSWPANGGGAVSGTLSYLSDKDDARTSATAFQRATGLIYKYHTLLTQGLQARLLKQACDKHPDNGEQIQALFTRLLERECKVTLNLLCHSMGNYLAKYAICPSGSALRELVFDNVALVAADTNNLNHKNWVDNFQTRNRLYVVINENDAALKWSRRKPGEEQLARLGQYTRNLDATNANYIDLTPSKGVGSDHSYFKDKPVAGNAALKRMFRLMFDGGSAEDNLNYHADRNLYRL
ncbi:MAG: alpha/beta hydrolase, partial [Parahaliea sp.]